MKVANASILLLIINGMVFVATAKHSLSDHAPEMWEKSGVTRTHFHSQSFRKDTLRVNRRHGTSTIKHNHMHGTRRNEAEAIDDLQIPAATDEQLEALCRSGSCSYTNPEIEVDYLVENMEWMLERLKRDNIKLVDRTLKLTYKQNRGPTLLNITKIEDSKNYSLKFSDGRTIDLDDEYLEYMTKNISKLEFYGLKNLDGIEDGFFETYFPNLENLTLDKAGELVNDKPLKKLQIGYLPKLINLKVRYPIKGNLSGCKLPVDQDTCFAENIKLYIYNANKGNVLHFNMTDFHLPKNVSCFEGKFGKAVIDTSTILNEKNIDKVILEFLTTSQLAGLTFNRTVVKGSFQLSGGIASDKENLTRDLDHILHNPSIAKIWQWVFLEEVSDVPVPVVFGTEIKQPFEELDGSKLSRSPCAFSKNITDYSNEQSVIKNRIKEVRGFYIDMKDVIDTNDPIKSEFDVLKVTAFHIHVSETRNVTYKLVVSYMKVTSLDGASVNHIHPFPANSKGSSASQLDLRDSVDAAFVQAIKVCTAILIAQEQNLGTLDSSENSVGTQMRKYQLPQNLTGPQKDVVMAEQMIGKVAELLEYLQEATLQKAMRIPYLSMQYQQKNMDILLGMAENIEDERRHNEMIDSVEELQKDILDNQDRSALALLQTEYKRTVSLVLISSRRAHDIEKKLKSTINLVKEVSVTFDRYQEEIEAANETFQAGVQRAQAFAIAEVAAAVTSSVISFFSGGFDPGKIARAAKKMKDMAYKIKKLMNLKKIFRKLANLVNILRNIQDLSTKATESMSGRLSRLFERIKNFKIKRKSKLAEMIEKSGSFPTERLALIKKEHEAEKFIEKYTRILENIKTGRDSIDYLNTAMQGLVEAEKTKVALANAFATGEVQENIEVEAPDQTVTLEDVLNTLNKEFIIAGDEGNQLNNLTETLKEYELTKSKNVIQKGEELNAADVLEWDAANANIEGTMDASISMDIPETTAFKAALMKMNLAGKLKTQSMIDEAAIRIDLDRARFETTTYFKEGGIILKKISEIEKNMIERADPIFDIESDEFKRKYEQKRKDERLLLGWKTFNVKFNILVDSMSYCSAYYYFHLASCPPDNSFDFDTSLPNIVHQQRELKRQSLLQLEDFYPPPQSMENRTMIFSEPNDTCTCMLQKMKEGLRFNETYQELAGCVKHNEIESANTTYSENTTKILLEALFRGCADNKVLEMRNFSQTIIPIHLNDSIGEGDSRVRVDEIQVYLHGAVTNSGVIKISIETSGLSQDRYAGRIFNFYGDKWMRKFSYYSPQNKAESQREGKVLVQEKRILDSANIHPRFRGVYRTSTLFTSWLIKIDPERNPGLNLTNLHRIEIKFAGSFVAALDYKLENEEENGNDEEEVERKSSCPSSHDNCTKDHKGWYSSV